MEKREEMNPLHFRKEFQWNQVLICFVFNFVSL